MRRSQPGQELEENSVSRGKSHARAGRQERRGAGSAEESSGDEPSGVGRARWESKFYYECSLFSYYSHMKTSKKMNLKKKTRTIVTE